MSLLVRRLHGLICALVTRSQPCFDRSIGAASSTAQNRSQAGRLSPARPTAMERIGSPPLERCAADNAHSLRGTTPATRQRRYRHRITTTLRSGLRHLLQTEPRDVGASRLRIRHLLNDGVREWLPTWPIFSRLAPPLRPSIQSREAHSNGRSTACVLSPACSRLLVSGPLEPVVISRGGRI